MVKSYVWKKGVELKNIRKGSRVSRFLRQVLEKTNIKKAIGANLAILAVSSSVIPSFPLNQDVPSEIQVIESPIIFTTNYTPDPRFPVDEVKITQKYSVFHTGVDFDGITGDSIRPIMGGVVVRTEISRVGYGNNIVIDHKNGYFSLYAHLSKIEVEKDEEITPSTVIGKMGATGRSFGDHLHLEVYQNGKRINPLSILK